MASPAARFADRLFYLVTERLSNFFEFLESLSCSDRRYSGRR